MARTITGAWVAAMCAIVMASSARPGAAGPAKTAAKPKATTSVTLTGCLRADGNKFVLTHLQGEQAPKGRSWKTGFVKKTTRDIEVVSAASGPKLKDQVGHQVTLTGVKDSDTHVQARSIKRLGASCQ